MAELERAKAEGRRYVRADTRSLIEAVPAVAAPPAIKVKPHTFYGN
jgi:hypothetical protein